MTTDQKIAAVFQACKDVVICLDRILSVHQSSVVAYARWYREEHPDDTDYSSLISSVTCQCIADVNLMSSRIPRQGRSC